MRGFIALIATLCLLAPFALASAADVELSGAIEVEVGFTEENNVKGEDITTSTMAIGFDTKVAEQVEGHAVLLFEEDDTEPIAVDEAFIVISPSEALFIQAGSYAVAFGAFESLLISDPLTTGVGETSQSAITVGINTGPATIQFGTFNGDVFEAAEDEEKINTYFLSAGYSAEYGSGIKVNASASYISSLAESDGLEGEVVTKNGNGDPVVDSTIAGYGAYINVGYERFTFIAEYIVAASEFDAADFGAEIKPEAYNLEFGADISDSTAVAFRYGGTKDLGTVLPETVTAAMISHGIYDNTTLAVEYLKGSFDDDTGLDDISALTIQLAIEF
jgi:hypothetical protein